MPVPLTSCVGGPIGSRPISYGQLLNLQAALTKMKLYAAVVSARGGVRNKKGKRRYMRY